MRAKLKHALGYMKYDASGWYIKTSQLHYENTV